MPASVTVHSDGPGGAAQAITIAQTGPDTAHIEIASAHGAGQSDDVKTVRADPDGLTLVCQLDAFLLTGDISVVVRRGDAGRPPVATITVTHAIAFNGPHVFPLRAGDDDAVQAFLEAAGFPALQEA